MAAFRVALNRTALVYDFDGTLARGNMQENSFIPCIGMTAGAFWDEVAIRKQAHNADEILVYMQLVLEKARGIGTPLTRAMLHHHGKTPDLFPGLADRSWFARINRHAYHHGLKLEHYIISSGIYEMIAASPIAGVFRYIFASRFIHDADGVAVWPGVAINYTTKTQYLFRINKGINNHWNSRAINEYMPEAQRPIPFARMIFIGDGVTDIPAMKVLTWMGGHPVAVYDPQSSRGSTGQATIHRLIADGRVDFVAPADYSEWSQLDIIVKGILGRIASGAQARGDGQD